MKKHKNKDTIFNYLFRLNEIPLLYIWMFFVVFDSFVCLYINPQIAILFALFMIPIFIHDILLKFFKYR